MGLDMYLHRKNIPKDVRVKIIQALENENPYEQVYYWRKEWAIHNWMCEHFDIENCVEVDISKEEFLNFLAFVQTLGKADEPDSEGEGVYDTNTLGEMKKIYELGQSEDMLLCLVVNDNSYET